MPLSASTTPKISKRSSAPALNWWPYRRSPPLPCRQIISALYIGGGFPEVHASALAANSGFLRSLHEAAQNGLPIYAECGGLMVLSRAIVWQGSKYPMAGVLPFEAHVCSTAQGHGYAEILGGSRQSVFRDRPRPSAATSSTTRKSSWRMAALTTACEVRRGKGIGQGRDGVIFKNVWAGLHACSRAGDAGMGRRNAASRAAIRVPALRRRIRDDPGSLSPHSPAVRLFPETG